MRCKLCGGILAIVAGKLFSLTEFYKCRHCKQVWSLGPVKEPHGSTHEKAL
jgi:phage FluMu protein Com